MKALEKDSWKFMRKTLKFKYLNTIIMWKNLTSREQLQIGRKIRKHILDGNETHETVYEILKFGEFYFFVEMISVNGKDLPEEQRIGTPYSIQNILYHGFKIWVE